MAIRLELTDGDPDADFVIVEPGSSHEMHFRSLGYLADGDPDPEDEGSDAGDDGDESQVQPRRRGRPRKIQSSTTEV